VLDAHPGRQVEVARMCNEFQASLTRDHPSRFGAFALLPLPDVEASMREMAYALDVLKMDGIGLFSNQGNVYLGDPRLDPLFEELSRRKAVVFVHPAHCCAPQEKNLGAPDGIVEYVIDTTRAIVNLLYNGTLDRYPDIRMIVSHAGGTVPFLAHRITGLERARGRRVPPVMPMLRSLYYDITSASSCHALRSLQELAEPSRILWGSDLPFVAGKRLENEVEEWEAYDGFAFETRTAIESQNALKLFPRLYNDARLNRR
jgi:predicted TIM-barrel fold metal-dependent hydrolase